MLNLTWDPMEEKHADKQKFVKNLDGIKKLFHTIECKQKCLGDTPQGEFYLCDFFPWVQGVSKEDVFFCKNRSKMSILTKFGNFS